MNETISRQTPFLVNERRGEIGIPFAWFGRLGPKRDPRLEATLGECINESLATATISSTNAFEPWQNPVCDVEIAV